MNITVVGTGYVGLVTGTCFAAMGNNVTCVDIDSKKVAKLKKGQVPIHEPGLEKYFLDNIKKGRMHFTHDIQEALDAEAIFLALPTPPGKDGSADLSYILGVAEVLGKSLKNYTVVVDKSTVPVGTAKMVRDQIAKNAKVDFDVVSNPEFLREGQAVADFLKPDRIVIGTSSKRAEKVMRRLYGKFVKKDPSKLIVTSEESAEMIKYAANGFLATKISFINELSQLCEAAGADVEMVRKGMGTDARIGEQFLYPGPGYGGSCFPKDTLALEKTGKQYGYKLGIVRATIEANEKQKQVIPNKVRNYYKGSLKGKTFALWGLAFKDNTDDVRESPALVIIDMLTKKGAKIVAYDPEAIETTKQAVGNNKLLSYAKGQYEALKGADALIVATNWKHFAKPDFIRIKKQLKAPVIFDGRNMYELQTMQKEGFYYESIGRAKVNV